jgi:hypothetical protein
MNQQASEWIALAFPLYVVIWFCGAANELIFRRYFRKKHPEIAREVFPTILNKSIGSDLRGWRYVWKRGYATIPDPEFVKRCDTHRLIGRICFAGVALGLILFATFLSTHGKK